MIMMRNLSSYSFLLILLFWGCQSPAPEKEKTPEITVPRIFSKLSPESSGISFVNYLKEDSVVNYFTYPYIYMGGGVAVGDINNDGLQDIYFTANMVDNKLYLNQGDLKFSDITDAAGVASDDRWVTGVTMADVNADGWLDIYVSVSGKFTTTANQLFLNQGVDDQGVPRFEEVAQSLGIADEGQSTQATFFDYDKDGDLDLYVANYPHTSFKTANPVYRFKMDLKDPEHSDKLYRNLGDGTFMDVTEAAGLLNFGLSLGVVTGDFDQNGWEDLYVSNDFATPDYFYYNNGDGTFVEKTLLTTKHTSYFGMGIDAGDLNNDGWQDLLQMDMTPEDNRRNKANMASMNPTAFYEMVSYGMHYQYMQNAVQLNNGVNESGYPSFSDIARITGIATTDWSWAGLFADLDNDGLKDVFVTNGTRKDINNKDYFYKIDHATKEEKAAFDYVQLSKEIPHERVDNYAFKNHGDLSFSNVVEDWGLSFAGYSNGAAYADLDNDGDLEVIINNIDDPSMIFENHANERLGHNFIRINLQGPQHNPLGLGTKIAIRTGNQWQYHHHTLTRGFQSSVEPLVHFGLATEQIISELIITWPDGKIQRLSDIGANRILEIKYTESQDTEKATDPKPSVPFFKQITTDLGIDYLHQENPYYDFEYEVLLPHVYSQLGPALAVGDANEDGLEDFFVGAAANSWGVLYLQNQEGGFSKSASEPWRDDADSEDIGAVFFDADGDQDLDLYVVSGGNEFRRGSPEFQDRLYENLGQGRFQRNHKALPEVLTSGSRVKPADYDGDGDLDLFVGGRLSPRSYPLPTKSHILRNDSESGNLLFTDVTSQVAPDLEAAGMVTDAVWVDYDQDQQLDLVIVGEWMPITVLRNRSGKFKNMTEEYGLTHTSGWWYSITAGDFDEDGDMDLVAGNLGLNYKYQASLNESFDVYAYDYDKNGNLDIVLGYYQDGVQYPVRGRQCSSQQIPVISVKFEDYNSFAEATLTDIYSEQDLQASVHYQAFNFASSYIQNNGNGQFTLRNLPPEVQLSSINSIVPADFNGDGNLDMLVAGNLYGAEVETTRNDAGYGSLLLGDGKGNFRAVPQTESGFHLPHDTKELASLQGVNGTLIIAANNQDYLKALQVNVDP